MEQLIHEFSEKVAKAKNDLLKNILAKHGFCYDDVFQKKVELYALDMISRKENGSHILYIAKEYKIIDCVEIFEKTETDNGIMTYKTWCKDVQSDLKYDDLLEIFKQPDPNQTTLFDIIGEQ
jgi:hypothetical protein